MSAPIITLQATSLGQGMPATEAAPRDADATSRVRLRLTRRGRAVFGTLGVLLVALLLGAAALFGSAPAEATGVEGEPGAFGYIVVQPGESLWGVATALDPSADPRDVIAEIVRLNQLAGSDVQAGQPIAVPLRYADSPGVISGAELGLVE